MTTMMTDSWRDSLTARLMREGQSRERAERSLDAAVTFLRECAATDEPLVPSPLADAGWHAMLLYTREYAAFCNQLAGRFIHHVPDETKCHDCADCKGDPDRCKAEA